jgi:two-component system, OmpR family, response regulator
VSRVRVLVVDDEEDFATAVTERLIRRGFDASSALSGARALKLLEESRFDVVTLDLKMPGMDGLATLREIRKIDPRIPVILLTGHGTVSSGIEGMQGGAADFLQKPVTIEILGTAIAAAAERARSNRAIAGPEGEGGET